jgi:hypothetical protein
MPHRWVDVSALPHTILESIFLGVWFVAESFEPQIMPGRCNRCGASLIQIDHHGNRLTGCLACNRWQGDVNAFVVEVEVEDWTAFGKLSNSLKWTLCPKKIRG